jgi:hypothetical protein
VYFPGSPIFCLPDWFPPFVLRECVELHTVLVAYIDENELRAGWRWDRATFYEVIRYAWVKRLPIQPTEIWQLLASHGVPKYLKEEIAAFFTEGTRLLVYAMGRPAVKKMRQRRIHEA